MSFTTYDELQAGVRAWSHRNDLNNQIPDFIALAEARLGRKLSLLDWNTSAPLTVTDNTAELPADYKGLRSLTYNGKPLTYVTPSQLAEEINPYSSGSAPVLYTVAGSTITLGPDSAADEVTLLYIARLVPLSDAQPTNWLLTNHPDLMFYGAMEALCSYIKDQETEAKWAGKFAGGIGELEIEDAFSTTAGTPLQIRSA